MKKRIVVIDDDSVILDITSHFLTNAGFEVDATDCGLYSNSLIYTNPLPNLILVDVMMPLMTGDEKLKSLKSNRKSRDIPVVLMSAKTKEELSALAGACGANGYLTKPFTESGLLMKVREFIQK
ncbi:response regulator [Trichloromonas sp.]|uniref:response regulator n=1 Tax=Trichloromonas sp. TaxID=3069249 RepID=UPI003D81317B